MIITHISGGLGNQLFMYALGRCLANKHNTELKLEINDYLQSKDSHHNNYKLGAFNVQENFATSEEIKNMKFINQDWKNAWVFISEILETPDNIYLKGWWQSEKYFLEIEKILRHELTLKNPLTKKSAEWQEKILSANCAISMHVRHGDYLSYFMRYNHRLLPPKHYAICLNELKKNFSDITVFIFSDDVQWCKENLKFDVPTEFVEGCEYDYEELYLMSLCKHNIITQSTFSWWGAWLNQNPNKKVFAPYPWHMVPPYGEDIIPATWLKVPINYKWWMPPIISIIVYVEDNLSTINFSLSSILSQKFGDYEIILVDASTDASGEFCRKAAGNNNITLLTVDNSATKFSAWNKALEVARGDYILFLTAKNIVLPYTTNLLVNICNKFLTKYATGKNNYLTYATYTNYLPNVICTTQTLNEDDQGTLNIGLPNKKFAAQFDVSLKNFNTLVELNLSDSEKLLTLGTKGINSSVTTKFFKRKFLNENHIRFNETGGGYGRRINLCRRKFFEDENHCVFTQSNYRTA